MTSDKPIDPKPALAPDGLTYIELLNSWHAMTRLARGDKPEKEPIKPFQCTGSAHLMGEHIRCTSPAHVSLVSAFTGQSYVAGPDGQIIPFPAPTPPERSVIWRILE